MTAICLKSKSSLSTETWSNIFGFNTDVKSWVFIKQLTSTCISTILHLRKVLPDDYFEEKSFEGMTLKLLKPRKGENYVTKIERWLEGAFEAMEKKYLKGLMLDIQDAESNLTLEIYTMTYNYNKENDRLNPLALASGFSISDTKLNTIKLLQMCEAVTQKYSSLPSQVKLSMRLSYYENTPEDYHPIGYVAWEPVDIKFPKPARSIEIGITGTQYHFFKLFNKSCLSDKFFQDLEEHLEKSSTSSEARTEDIPKNISLERQTKAKRELCFDNPLESVQSSLLVSPKGREENLLRVSEKRTSVFNNQTERHKLFENVSRKGDTTLRKGIKVSKKVIRADVRNQRLSLNKVRCACLSSDRTETMFPCLGCGFLVHAECYGILQFDSTKKVRFYCHLCHQKENNTRCHDKVIMSLKSSSDQQKLSLLRRVLRHCNMPFIHKITIWKMNKILGSSCPKNLLQIILNKLTELGVALPQRYRKSYLIDKETLANKLVYYFYKVQKSNEKMIPYSLRPLESLKGQNNNYLRHSKTRIQDVLTCNSQNSEQSCDIFC